MRKRAWLFSAAALLLFCSSGHAAPPRDFPPGKPEKKFYVGEKLTYQIQYLGIPVGESTGWIREKVTRQGRPAYHIQVNVHSYRWVDWVYKVRDEHHAYVDAETFASLGYEKKIQEGRRRIYEKMEFDLERRKAVYYDAAGKVLNEVSLPDGPVQDQLSCGYWVRILDFKSDTSVRVPVHADGKNWDMEVKFFEESPVEIKKVGRFRAVRSRPGMEFKGIFIRKGEVEGWISLDARRIPLTMGVKIPVLGAVEARLVAYQPGE